MRNDYLCLFFLLCLMPRGNRRCALAYRCVVVCLFGWPVVSCVEHTFSETLFLEYSPKPDGWNGAQLCFDSRTETLCLELNRFFDLSLARAHFLGLSFPY